MNHFFVFIVMIMLKIYTRERSSDLLDGMVVLCVSNVNHSVFFLYQMIQINYSDCLALFYAKLKSPIFGPFIYSW